MSSEELRTLLRERAEVTDALGPAGRLDAVHGRVRSVVRRRRRGFVASAAAAAVVVAGASVVPTLRSPAPNPADQLAPAVLAGRTVPPTQTATGYSYHYVRGVQSRPGAKELRLSVHAQSSPKLVMWATSSNNPAPVVRLHSNLDDEHFRSAAGGFERYLVVYPSDTVRLKLTQQDAPARNRLALAVYALDRTPPPGISNGVVTFRQTILDDRLVTGKIGEPGQTDLRTTVAPQHGVIRVSSLCYGGSADERVHVGIAGQGQMIADGCSASPDFDPGGSGDTYTPDAASGTSPVRLHIWLTDAHDAPVSDPDAVLGMAVYRVGGRTFRLAGQRLPVWQERDGHVWVNTVSQESARGARSVTLRVTPSDVPRLVTIADSGYGHGYAMTNLLVDGVQEIGFEDASGSGGTVSSGYVIQPGEAPTLTLRVKTRSTAHTLLGIALSDQVH